MQRTPVVTTVLAGLVVPAAVLLLVTPPTTDTRAADPGPAPGNRGWATPVGEDTAQRVLLGT